MLKIGGWCDLSKSVITINITLQLLDIYIEREREREREIKRDTWHKIRLQLEINLN